MLKIIKHFNCIVIFYSLKIFGLKIQPNDNNLQKNNIFSDQTNLGTH